MTYVDTFGRRRRHGRSGLFAPVLLIGLGIVFLLDQLNIYSADHAFTYFWPVVFIAWGLDLLVGRPCRRHAALGGLALAVGAALILRNLGYWAFDIGRLWPLILIFAGLSLLFRGPRHRWHLGNTIVPDGSSDSRLDGTAMFGGIERRITAQDFRGGTVTAVFGGFNIDLTQANIVGDVAVLDLSAVFGGGEVHVPNTWIIDIQGNALLGGYTDETHQLPPAPGAKRLIVQGTALFGGVVVKN